jgi:23S rRNA pseudouridine1911/1915/1917 synthase
MRLDLALIQRYPDISRRQARAAIEKGQVQVGGKETLEAGSPVPDGADIVWDRNRKARARARLTLPILHQDDVLLIVDKPAGLLSVPTSRPPSPDEDTALARVTDFAERLHCPYAAAAHRLDRETSGALAFALRRDVHETLKRTFGSHTIERRYLAIVEHTPRETEGTIVAPIRDLYAGGKRGVARPGEAASSAITRWRVQESFAHAALLEIQIETGRQHQIRIHLAHIGHPVVGDPTYRPPDRTSTRIPAPRVMLHAQVLGLTHPLTGQVVRVTSPMPADFQKVIQQLRRSHKAEPKGAPKARS